MELNRKESVLLSTGLYISSYLCPHHQYHITRQFVIVIVKVRAVLFLLSATSLVSCQEFRIFFPKIFCHLKNFICSCGRPCFCHYHSSRSAHFDEFGL